MRNHALDLVKPPQVILCKMWCADAPALVKCLCDCRVFILSRSRDQHAALRAAGFRDCVLAGIKLVHLKSLAREHTYLRMG